MDMLLPTMDIFLPGPLMVDMLLPTVDMPLPGPPMVAMLRPTVDMLPPAMNTLLSEPTMVDTSDTSFGTEGYA